jgi:hypothetical protein
LAIALENVVGMRSEHELFTAGDVHIVAALPWYQDTDADSFDAQNYSGDFYSEDFNSVRLGIKVVAEISIFNPLSSGSNATTLFAPEFDGENDSPLSSMFQNFTDRLRGRKPKLTCASTDLYSLAQSALKAKEVLRSHRFMISLIEELKSMGDSVGRVAFGPINSPTYDITKSSILSVWLIRTGIDEEINYFGPQKPITVKVIVFIQNMVFLSFVFFLGLVLWGGCTSLYEYLSGRPHPIKRRNRYIISFLRGQQPYAIVPREEEAPPNPNDVEDSLLRGSRGAQPELTHRRSYKLTVPKKRLRYGNNANLGSIR